MHEVITMMYHHLCTNRISFLPVQHIPGMCAVVMDGLDFVSRMIYLIRSRVS